LKREMIKMKKRLFVLLAVIVVLSMASTPALAVPPEDAGGVWCYMPATLVVEKVVGGNQFWTTSDVGYWTGTFHSGVSPEDPAVSEDHCSAVLHSSGYLWGHCTVSFAAVTVDGQTGGLEMSVLLSQPYAGAEWDGKWVITGGTGDLNELRGQGTMSGPGYNPEEPEDCGVIDYSGNYHFEAD
jgi:hypothetical protein